MVYGVPRMENIPDRRDLEDLESESRNPSLRSGETETLASRMAGS